ncbi:helix-turn-helix domain-containing protein [Prevotella sp. E15-22]|uniref:helix-turn-helix domain-containing protein n=1 Tax=Prevotella sp. E15-22 TaxID=2937774 RepID=UPI002055F2BB|nr:helix-turn-helix domain-containing protein [Prevotella sp. E15-22]UPS44255.1 helix-turn-helix domain-containing protein [Prevotella sp. E15-22]
MKQRLPIVVLFALIVASSLFSLNSYRTTEVMVTEEMNQALAKALEEQQSEVISADTIRVFNNYLQTEDLKGKAVLALDTEKGFQPRPQVSTATILALSDQRPSMVLWSMVVLWGMYCLYQHRRRMAMGMFGGLALQEGNFVDAKGCVVRLTPMQQQLMEMLWQSPSHKLSKTEICDALWPKKEDASETLYTLVRRLKPIIEEHSNLKIEVDRGRAYGLTIR